MKKFAPLFVVTAAVLWGLDGVLLRPELYMLPVPLVVFIESTLAALLLSVFLLRNWKAKTAQLKLKDWAAFAGVALFGGAIGTMAITKALFYVNFVNLSIVVLMQKLQPIFALLLATVILHEKLSKEFFLWAAAAILGAYLMTFGISLPDITAGDKTAIAAGYALLAAFSFGSSTVLSKRALKNINFEFGSYLRFIFSSGILLVIVLASGELHTIVNVSIHQWLIFLLIAFTTGGAAIFLYYYGLKNIRASSATILELAFPLTAIVFEYLLRGNILSIAQWCGVALLVYSIIRVSKLR